MSDFQAYIWAAAGVIVAVILPVLSAYIRQEFPPVAGVTIPPWLKRYAALFVFSLIVAGVSLAIWRSQNPEGQLQWFTAFLVGFGWESAIEKFGRPKP
ncbi:MAG: hypothetical protein K8F58_14565 [Bauldia sp.]|nr:hypothetical protein [Bauldia sp.]